MEESTAPCTQTHRIHSMSASKYKTLRIDHKSLQLYLSRYTWPTDYASLVLTCPCDVLIVATRPSITGLAALILAVTRQLVWMSAVNANMHNSSAQDRRVLVSNLTGTAGKSDYDCKTDQSGTTANGCIYCHHSYVHMHSSYVFLNILSENKLSTAFRCIL